MTEDTTTDALASLQEKVTRLEQESQTQQHSLQVTRRHIGQADADVKWLSWTMGIGGLVIAIALNLAIPWFDVDRGGVPFLSGFGVAGAEIDGSGWLVLYVALTVAMAVAVVYIGSNRTAKAWYLLCGAAAVQALSALVGNAKVAGDDFNDYETLAGAVLGALLPIAVALVTAAAASSLHGYGRGDPATHRHSLIRR